MAEGWQSYYTLRPAPVLDLALLTAHCYHGFYHESIAPYPTKKSATRSREMVPCDVRQHVFSRAPSLIERPRGPRLAPPTPTIRIIACAGVSPMAATATLSRAPCMRCAESRAGQLLQVSACRMVRKRQKRKCRVAAYFAASILRDPSSPESVHSGPNSPAVAEIECTKIV